MKVLLTKKAAKELDKVPDQLARNIVTRMRALSNDPFPGNSMKLSGKDTYRMRVGVYRVLYWVDAGKDTITVLRVAHRRHVYR